MVRLALTLLIALALFAAGKQDLELMELWRAARVVKNFKQPDAKELATAETLLSKMLAPTPDLTLEKSWLALHVLQRSAQLGKDKIWTLQEAQDSRFGRGFLAIRQGEAKPILLQAPHSRSDLHTEDIAFALFAEDKVRAAIWNTASRTQGDLAHAEESYFQAVSRAFAATNPKGIVLQLHGFDKAKRRTKRGQSQEIILSNGSANPPASYSRLAARLAQTLTTAVGVYPHDAKELGATTNTQAKALVALKKPAIQFVHVELSLKQRQRLQSEVKLRQSFISEIWSILGSD